MGRKIAPITITTAYNGLANRNLSSENEIKSAEINRYELLFMLIKGKILKERKFKDIKEDKLWNNWFSLNNLIKKKLIIVITFLNIKLNFINKFW